MILRPAPRFLSLGPYWVHCLPSYYPEAKREHMGLYLFSLIPARLCPSRDAVVKSDALCKIPADSSWSLALSPKSPRILDITMFISHNGLFFFFSLLHFHDLPSTPTSSQPSLPKVWGDGESLHCHISRCSLPEYYLIFIFLGQTWLSSGMPSESITCFIMQIILQFPFF